MFLALTIVIVTVFWTMAPSYISQRNVSGNSQTNVCKRHCVDPA